MPLKLNVGYSKKIGQPDYGSLGASCNVEVELDQYLVFHDLDGLHAKIKQVFVAARQAVHDELYRHKGSPPPQNGNNGQLAASGKGSSGNGGSGNGQRRGPGRRATTSQVRAINSIAERLQLDLARWLHEKFGMGVPADLSISDASHAIDELKALPAGSQNGGRY
jgi:hypothetical protein